MDYQTSEQIVTIYLTRAEFLSLFTDCAGDGFLSAGSVKGVREVLKKKICLGEFVQVF
jgi:hypothetical protein